MPKNLYHSKKIKNENEKKKSQRAALTARTFTHILIKNREINNKTTHVFFI